MKQTIYIYLCCSNFGSTLIARTVTGALCALLFGNDPMKEINKIFKNYEMVIQNQDEYSTSIIDKINTCKLDNVPFEILIGTEFQKSVWNEICKIPKGCVVTYQSLASSIGKPSAVRAVGKACGDNPLAIAIPCHRVISKNKSKINYKYGKEMKTALLNKEMEIQHD